VLSNTETVPRFPTIGLPTGAITFTLLRPHSPRVLRHHLDPIFVTLPDSANAIATRLVATSGGAPAIRIN